MTMTLKQGIIEAAQALGINPLDLATAISFETGGTFNPTQVGPRTKWGQHRGLIQFGEPQAKQYGVDWNNALESQLGPNGAVVRYLRANGVRPGMTLLPLYATINAGGPGNIRAMDMGTSVSQKVYSDAMNKHREKASALLGGQFTPSVEDPGNSAYGQYSGQQDDPMAEINQVDMPDLSFKAGDKITGGLADTLAGATQAGDLSRPGGVEGDPHGDIAPLDYASAIPPPSQPFNIDFSPLASLFNLKTVGQAPALSSKPQGFPGIYG